MGEQHLLGQEGMGRCWQFLHPAGPTLERAGQDAHKPGAVGEPRCCQNPRDISEPWSRSVAPVDFGEATLGFTRCESTPVQCSSNLEIQAVWRVGGGGKERDKKSQ